MYKLKEEYSLDEESLKFIISIIKKYNISSILEIGTAHGYSAIEFSKFCKITTIEISKVGVSLARKFIKDNKNIKLIEGDALKEIPKLKENFDLIFLDGASNEYLQYFKLVLRLKPKIIIADNIESHKEKMQDFLEEIKKYNTKFIKIGKGLTLTYIS